MSAHGMAHDSLSLQVDGKAVSDHCRKIISHIGPHAEIRCPRRLCRINIEARALTEIISVIVGDGLIVYPTSAARARIWRDEYQPELGARGAVFAFLCDVRVRAGETGKVPDDRKLGSVLGLRGQVNRECHLGTSRKGLVLHDELPPAMRLVLGDDLDSAHSVMLNLFQHPYWRRAQ